MSGTFLADWLALREPADAAARCPAVMASAAAHLEGMEAPRICDLACGTGATLRGLAPILPRRQHWRLVDHDPALLARARRLLAAWADRSAEDGPALAIEKAGRRISVTFRQADLARDPRAWEADTDMVTASALFDLTSECWMEGLARRLVADRMPLLALLTYDGRAALTPPDAADERVIAAVNRHQRRDKGFGPAAGPDAAAVLARCLTGHGWQVDRGESDWRLGEPDTPLMMRTIEGWCAAAAEDGAPAALLEHWMAERRRGLRALSVGHVDLFARPAS
jgi:SAM-dependent methyltransferase